MGSKHEGNDSAWRGSPRIKYSPEDLAEAHQEEEPSQRSKWQGLISVCSGALWVRVLHQVRGIRLVPHALAGVQLCHKSAMALGLAKGANNSSHWTSACFSYRNKTLRNQGHGVFNFFNVNLGFGCAGGELCHRVSQWAKQTCPHHPLLSIPPSHLCTRTRASRQWSHVTCTTKMTLNRPREELLRDKDRIDNPNSRNRKKWMSFNSQ